MRAVRITTLDGPGAVEVAAVDEPTPGPGQVLVDVHAAAVTFPEVLQTRGRYQIKPDPPFVPGSSVAGVVRSAPDGSALRPGQRVAAMAGLGGFAEVAVAEPAAVFPLPDRVGFPAATALPLNYLTAHFALVQRGRLADGETVLVHGAAGGVGTATGQLARALGARVLAVVSSDAKGEVARAAGAHEVLPADGFLGAVKELTGGRGVDVVVDPVGGDRFTDSLRATAPEGRVLVIGFTAGEIPTVRVNRLLLNNIDVVGVGWGAFWARRPEYLQEQWAFLLPHLESGALDPVLGPVFPLDAAADALRELDERRATGQVVLQVR